MATIIELPQVGESVIEGVIGKWLKQPGEHVDKYEPLVEVLTDKVNMEVPSPFAGTLTKTLVDEGDTVPMGQPIAEMDVEGDADSQSVHPEHDEKSQSARPEPVEGSGGSHAHETDHEAFEFNENVRSVGPTGSGEGGEGRRDAIQEATVRLSPIVRRLVAEHGVPVEALVGTGMGGRITKDDVLRYVAAHGPAGAPGPGSTGSPRADAGAPRADARSPGAGPPPAHPEPVEGRASETTQHAVTPLRRAIAEHLSRSAREIPAAWAMVEVDVSGLVRFRAAHRDAFARTAGVPLTYLPFAAQAAAQALLENPLLNGRWEDGHITLHSRVHMGIAVSTEQGLYVPVVHEADLLNLEGLAVRIHEVAEAARSGTLKLEDVQGGTFTLNNTGALGSVVSVPIINHPQAAIMTTEAIVKRPVVMEGDAIAVRSMMNLCMAFDHRVCDGADVGRFMSEVKSRLESIDEHSPLL